MGGNSASSSASPAKRRRNTVPSIPTGARASPRATCRVADGLDDFVR